MKMIQLPRDPSHEFVRVMCHATVEKRTDEYDEALGLYLRRGHGLDAAEALAASAVPPYEVVEGDYNAMSNAGIDALLLLLVGGGGTAFNNSNAYLGVGDSTDSFDAADTDLQASSNKVRKAMSASFPATGTHLQTFKSVFDGSSGNFAWNEWAIFNASSSGTMLNRKVESLGTKASGSWSLAVTFALA